MTRNYQKLHERIFMGGVTDVEDIVKNEGCNVVVYLRSEASEPSTKNQDVTYIYIPLIDSKDIEDPDESLQKGCQGL